MDKANPKILIASKKQKETGYKKKRQEDKKTRRHMFGPALISVLCGPSKLANASIS